MEDEQAQINSEIRFITLELMKIAVKRKVPFRTVMDEFIQNVYQVERTIKKRALKRSRRKARKTVELLARRDFEGHR